MTSDPPPADTPPPFDKDRLAQMALDYHKTVEGEYGCPGLSCPGVQRLIIFADEVALATAQGTARQLEDAHSAITSLEHAILWQTDTFEEENNKLEAAYAALREAAQALVDALDVNGLVRAHELATLRAVLQGTGPTP